MKRLIGPLLLVLLLAGVGTAIYFSVRDSFVQRSVVTVRGLVSSEKEEFFRDPLVTAALKRGGFTVEYEKAGSRQIATSYDLKPYDFAFPAGAPAATKIMTTAPGAQSYDVFYTPMVIASWKPIVQILMANGVVTEANGIYTFNMEAYLKLVDADTRWRDLKDAGAYPVGKSMLISSSDPRKASSAGMYLGIASYLLNDSNIVQSDADIQKVQPVLSALILRQGFTEYATEVPFEDYLTMGMGKSPMVMIYESQYIERSARADGAITPEMVLMYPSPTILSKSIVVALNDNGARFAQFLKDDPELQRLAVEHGYRTADQAYFLQFKQSRSLAGVPDQVINVIDPPSYEVLEKMIANIDAKLK